MSNYNINYEILDYDKYNKRLEDLLSGDFVNLVTKHEPLGYTSCGFPIDHYSIGNGPIHVTYMGGAHGNEIIGVDFVTQLMNNLALGKGSLKDIDLNQFTIDFIPCQNPEGFYVTTYALKQVLEGMSEDEVEAFSKQYWRAYREDDQNASKIKKLINEVSNKFGIPSDGVDQKLWANNLNNNINCEVIGNLFHNLFGLNYDECLSFIRDTWNSFGLPEEISSTKKHLELLDKVSIDCIPLIDSKHVLLKKKIERLYNTGSFPLSTLANFFANSDGVNLNDNNEPFYHEFKEKMNKYGVVTGNLRDNTIIKSINGPLGLPSIDMMKPFQFTLENQAVLNYMNNLENNCAFINVHGTGGMLFIYPVWSVEDEVYNERGVVRDFRFFINNRLGTEYSRESKRTFKEEYGIDNFYDTVSYPDRVTGFGDHLRKNFDSALLLELSKMGGNPLAPYGDRNGNYEITLVSNFNAFKVLLDTILSLQDLYSSSYVIERSGDEVKYSSIPRVR